MPLMGVCVPKLLKRQYGKTNTRSRKVKPIQILMKKETIEQTMEVASAGPYANHLQLAPDR